MASASKRRLTLRWLLVGITFLAGVGCLIGIIVSEVQATALRLHGIQTVATVEAERQDGRQKSYLIAFKAPDQSDISFWSTFVHDDTKVGDRIIVTYDPQQPDNLREGSGQNGSQIVIPIFFGPLSVFLLWISFSATRPNPKGPAGWLLNSSSRPYGANGTPNSELEFSGSLNRRRRR